MMKFKKKETMKIKTFSFFDQVKLLRTFLC